MTTETWQEPARDLSVAMTTAVSRSSIMGSRAGVAAASPSDLSETASDTVRGAELCLGSTRINRSPVGSAVGLDDEMAGWLTAALAISRRTAGAFDQPCCSVRHV